MLTICSILNFSSFDSFVFIITISYILSYLPFRDKCFSHVSSNLNLLSTTRIENFLPCDIEMFLKWESSPPPTTDSDTSTCIAAREKSTNIFTCFSFSHPRHTFQSVHFLLQHFQPSLSAALEENVMNENVFYVILHNIIVFNKQISLSLHLIVKRTSQKLSIRAREGIFS